MSKKNYKGGCGNLAKYKGWCKIKWQSGNRFNVGCTVIEKKRADSISRTRIKEAKLGKNPMQNPIICARNHSKERNRKASETLRELGKLGLLPQQMESKELKEKRRKNISRNLKKLFQEGKHPRQLESYEKKKKRLNKMANTLKALGKKGKLPVQNMSIKQKMEFKKKISKTLIKGIKSGRIKLSKSWKKVPYKSLVLRSNWEKLTAEFLDKKGFKWEYETLKIDYWDSERKRKAVTIPDFYIPSIGTIVEVKSNAEYFSQKTKDKAKAIKKKGFNFLLFGRKEIKLMKDDNEEILELFKSKSK